METPEKQVEECGEFPSRKDQFQPGQSGNPSGRKTAGATIREWVNSFVEKNYNRKQLRAIAIDPEEGSARVGAAKRLLIMMETGDLADFSGLLKGEHNLEDLRAMGINTEVIKKFKQKTRLEKVKGGDDGELEEVIEREIELHDRSGDDFDRVVNHTDGNPTQRSENVSHTHITVDSARTAISAILARRLGESGRN